MIQPILATPRILVIEDVPNTREDITQLVRYIPEERRRRSGIRDFELDEAGSVTKAEQYLKEAKSRPYDLVLLDLQLPDTELGDGTESLGNGQNLLLSITNNQTAKGVVIVSGFPDYEHVIRSIRGGALDFVKKPIDPSILQQSVLNALARLMVEESNRILDQRVRDLVPYAEIGLAHSFKVIFSTLLQGVAEAADGIEKYARERYGLDTEKDANDSLMLKLRTHRKAVTQARKEWAGLQAELARGGHTLETGDLGQMLRDLKESLLPCLVVKKVVFDMSDFAERPVMTFERDVEVVLREILVGLLSELPDYGEDPRIKITVAAADARAEVRFEDDLDPIPEPAMVAINEGKRILPDARFGRAWGLSVAQHVALRGGGELKVKTERGRNVVTYYIPAADHA